MIRTYCGAAALCAAAAFWHPPAAAAVSQSCRDLRGQIAKLEREVPSGAALTVDLAVRKIYVNDCLRHPSDGATPGSAARDPWFNANGDPASGPPPQGDGAYQTTAEIGSYCRGSADPQLCALMLNIGEGEVLAAGGDPENPADWEKPRRTIDPADELPPLRIAAAGATYTVEDACLGGLADILFPSGTGLRSRIAARLGPPQCTDELGAIKSALPALQDAIAAWRTTAQRDATAPIGADGRVLQPGFIEMCRQASNNQSACIKRQSDMRSLGGTALGSNGQAGAFGECADLYGSVVAMCRQSGVRLPQAPLRQALRPAQPPPAPRKNASGQSSPPPANAAGPPMSEACRGLVQNLVTAAKANDGPAAKASYDALQQAGGCGVMPASPATSAPDPRFAARGDTSMIDQTFGACDQQPERCDQAVNQLREGTSPAAIAALYANAIGIGLQLGAEMAQGMAAMQPRVNAGPPPGRQTDMRSLAAPPIRNGVGQGAPSVKPPPTAQSTITGTSN